MNRIAITLFLVIVMVGCHVPKPPALTELPKYTRDNRTGICFAYSRRYNDGLALATVPCEKIPKELLEELR